MLATTERAAEVTTASLRGDGVRSCALRQLARRRREPVDPAVAQRADESGPDDRTVGVVEHTVDLVGSGDADPDARVLDPVGAEAFHEGARRGIQLRPLPR